MSQEGSQLKKGRNWVFGPDGPQRLARGERFKMSVTRMGGVGHNPTCTPQSPGAVQVLKGWKVAANHLLSRVHDDNNNNNNNTFNFYSTFQGTQGHLTK